MTKYDSIYECGDSDDVYESIEDLTPEEMEDFFADTDPSEFL